MKKYGFLIVCVLYIFALSGCFVVNAITNLSSSSNVTTAVTVDSAPTVTAQEGYVTLPTLNSIPVYIHPSTTAPVETTVPSTTIGTNSMSDEVAVFFDFAQSHKPTETDINQIEEGMTIENVVELLGKPHDFGPTSGLLSLVWQTVEGNWYCIIVWSEASDDTPICETIFEHGTCWSIFQLDNELEE